MFVLSPLAAIGLAINSFALAVLLRSRMHRVDLLNKYLLFYLFNNLIVCLTISVTFVSMSPRYFPWFCSTFARIHRCVVLDLVPSTFLTINRALEILIICQRLANFKASFKRIERISWKKTYGLIVIVSVLINAPFFRNIKDDQQLADDLQHFEPNAIYIYCARDFLYDSKWVVYAKAVVTLFRDLFSVCIELAMSILLVIYLRRFIATKIRTINSTVVSIPSSQTCSQQSQRNESFKRTTRTIVQFSLFSVVSKLIIFVFYIVFTFNYNGLIINSFMIVIIFGVILKPFLTIFVLCKIDKNVRTAFRLSC